jgi:hypothetical protein
MSKITVTSTSQGEINLSAILRLKDRAIKEQIAVKSQEIRENAEAVFSRIQDQIEYLLGLEVAQELIKQNNKGAINRHHFATVMATILIGQVYENCVEDHELINQEVAYDLFYKLKVK